MKKFVIQDVTDRQYLCEDNTWDIDVTEAKMFDIEDDAWIEAKKQYDESNWALTVIPILCS